MIKKVLISHLRPGSLFLLVVATALPAGGATIWNGPLKSFTKTNGANPNDAANQDRLTSNVWLSRRSSQGLYNVQSEGSFAHFLSPSGTQWADGNLADFASLTYTNWNSWAKGVHSGPPSTVGADAVVHLLSDDIYLSVKFTSWSSGGSGGGFSYLRSTPVPEPGPMLLLGSGLAALAGLTSARRKERRQISA